MCTNKPSIGPPVLEIGLGLLENTQGGCYSPLKMGYRYVPPLKHPFHISVSVPFKPDPYLKLFQFLKTSISPNFRNFQFLGIKFDQISILSDPQFGSSQFSKPLFSAHRTAYSYQNEKLR